MQSNQQDQHCRLASGNCVAPIEGWTAASPGSSEFIRYGPGILPEAEDSLARRPAQCVMEGSDSAGMERRATHANHSRHVRATHSCRSRCPMKPAPFVWYAPETLDEALALKAEHGEEARFLAGGQSLVPAMNFRIAQPAVLIDLN